MEKDEIQKIVADDAAFKMHVVETTARIDERVNAVCDDVVELKGQYKRLAAAQVTQGKDIARLQVKAGVWGALSGVVTGLLAALGIGQA